MLFVVFVVLACSTYCLLTNISCFRSMTVSSIFRILILDYAKFNLSRINFSANCDLYMKFE